MNRICTVMVHNSADELGLSNSCFAKLTAAEAVEKMTEHITKELRLRVEGTLSTEDCELLDGWQKSTGKQLTPV
jgi:hypothetical protein